MPISTSMLCLKITHTAARHARVFKMLLLATLLCLSTACAPIVFLSKSGEMVCGGALTSPETVVTASHCSDADTALTLYGARIPVTVIASDPLFDSAILELEAPAWAPSYAIPAVPAVGQEAWIFGLCPLHVDAWVRTVRVGPLDVGAVEGPAWDGAWEVWASRDGGVICPGDSGSPLLGVRGVDGTPYYGSVSWGDMVRTSYDNPFMLPHAVLFGVAPPR